jgi:cell division protein FtsB
VSKGDSRNMLTLQSDISMLRESRLFNPEANQAFKKLKTFAKVVVVCDLILLSVFLVFYVLWLISSIIKQDGFFLDLMFQNKAKMREKNPANYAELPKYAFRLMILELIDLFLLSYKCWIGYKVYISQCQRTYVIRFNSVSQVYYIQGIFRLTMICSMFLSLSD